jgi:hypothetical protein
MMEAAMVNVGEENRLQVLLPVPPSSSLHFRLSAVYSKFMDSMEKEIL